MLIYFPAYRISQEKSLIFEEYGSWSLESGLQDVRRTPILSLRRRDLQGHLIVASGVILTPGAENFTDLDDYRYDIFENICFKLLIRLFFFSSHNKVEIGPKINKLLVTYQTRALNATLRYDVQRSWGYFDEKTGIANGMFGQIQRKEADISGIRIIKVIFIFSDTPKSPSGT